MGPASVPPADSPKGKVLEGYLRNAEQCVVKESYPKFNAMDETQRARVESHQVHPGTRRSGGGETRERRART